MKTISRFSNGSKSSSKWEMLLKCSNSNITWDQSPENISYRFRTSYVQCKILLSQVIYFWIDPSKPVSQGLLKLCIHTGDRKFRVTTYFLQNPSKQSKRLAANWARNSILYPCMLDVSVTQLAKSCINSSFSEVNFLMWPIWSKKFISGFRYKSLAMCILWCKIFIF